MNKNILVFLFLLCTTQVHSQVGNFFYYQKIEEENPYNYGNQYDQGQDSQPQGDQYNQEQQQQSMIKQAYIVSIIMSKHHLNSHAEELGKILQSQSQGQMDNKFYRKILCEHVTQCAQQLQAADMNIIIPLLQAGTFDVKQYAHYFAMLTLDRYTSPDYDREITREDEAILRLNDELEEQWEKQREQQQEEEDSSFIKNRMNRDQAEPPKILGLSAQDYPLSVQLCYFAGIFACVILVVYIGLQQIGSDDCAQPKKKKNKNKQN